MSVMQTIEQLIAEDRGNRGIAALVQPGHLQGAAQALTGAAGVVIVSGFYIPRAGAGETDGPPGAKAIGDALRLLGIEVAYLTDAPNLPLFQALEAEPLYTDWEALQAEWRPTHLLAIERVGRARDGRYYNMRGEDISAHTGPLDAPFLEAPSRGMTTIGIGDGGNEIGMGRVLALVEAHVPQGALIACTVPTDHLIVCGVSNWGAYGLVGALSSLTERELLPSAQEARDAVERIVAAGAVDGQTHRCEATVDQLPLSDSLDILERIRALVAG